MAIAIVGAGLAGLTAAHDLTRSRHRVTLFDAQTVAGGQIRTRREAGFLIEEGAEGFVAADSDVPGLCRDLGIADQIVPQVERRSLLYRNNTLSEMSSRDAASLLGIPVPDESSARGLSALRNGMGALIAALVSTLGEKAELRLSHAVTRIDLIGARWRVTADNGTSREADHLVLAVPPREAAGLLGPHDPEAASLLGSIVLMSNASVSLAFRRADVAHHLDASGLVTAPGEPNVDGLRACVFCSSKFADRAPPNAVLLRAFYRPEPAQLQAPDHEWVRRTTETLGAILSISASPTRSWVSRWPATIPQLIAEHANVMSQLMLRISRLNQVSLAGAPYCPGGVPGAVRSGRSLARQLSGSLPV